MKTSAITTFLIISLGIHGFLAAPAFAQPSDIFLDKLEIDKTDINRRGSMPNTYAPVVKRVLPAVVSISSARVTQRRSDPVWDEILRRYLGDDYVPQQRTHRQQQGLGSGVLVTPDGFIITNFHVIQGANEIIVTLPQSRESYEAEVVAADPSTDVALLKIEGHDFPRAVLADSDFAEVGDVVLAVGNPFELDQTVTHGIISAKGRNNVGPGGNFYGNFIQTDAAINPGNSGGALVDSSGRVIGINSMIYSTTGASTGIGFAIPINMALQVIGNLLDDGRITRGFLGVELESLSPAIARRLGRRDLSGALVKLVIPDSPADLAGLRPGDLILSYAGQRVPDPAKLRLDVSRTRPGTAVLFNIVRNGRLLDVPVELGETGGNHGYVNRGRWDRPEPEPGVAEPVVVEDDGEELTIPFYLEGIVTRTLDDSLREQLGLDATYEGAVVLQVNPKSAAGRQGLRVGDLIVEVGRHSVRSTREALEAGQDLEGESVILGIIRQGKEAFVLVRR